LPVIWLAMLTKAAWAIISGPKVEKLPPAATFLGSALPFQLYGLS
jgi:hypothetical protein